jgi:hypothetical protein
MYITSALGLRGFIFFPHPKQNHVHPYDSRTPLWRPLVYTPCYIYLQLQQTCKLRGNLAIDFHEIIFT